MHVDIECPRGLNIKFSRDELMKINMNNYVRLGPSYSMVEKYENTNTEQNHHSLGVQKACTKGIL